MNPPSLGYVILYVNDVAASLVFYEKAFGLTRHFFHDDNGKAYGELETGATRLAFASVALATEHLKQSVTAAAPDKPGLYLNQASLLCIGAIRCRCVVSSKSFRPTGIKEVM